MPFRGSLGLWLVLEWFPGFVVFLGCGFGVFLAFLGLCCLCRYCGGCDLPVVCGFLWGWYNTDF